MAAEAAGPGMAAEAFGAAAERVARPEELVPPVSFGGRITGFGGRMSGLFATRTLASGARG